MGGVMGIPLTTLIPVTSLTDFLGIGKTTVLNTLLRHPDMARSLVVINEFGRVTCDIDRIVIEDSFRRFMRAVSPQEPALW